MDSRLNLQINIKNNLKIIKLFFILTNKTFLFILRMKIIHRFIIDIPALKRNISGGD